MRACRPPEIRTTIVISSPPETTAVNLTYSSPRNASVCHYQPFSRNESYLRFQYDTHPVYSLKTSVRLDPNGIQPPS